MLPFFPGLLYFIQALRIVDCRWHLPVLAVGNPWHCLGKRMHVFGSFCPEIFAAIDGSPVDMSEISRRHR